MSSKTSCCFFLTLYHSRPLLTEEFFSHFVLQTETSQFFAPLFIYLSWHFWSLEFLLQKKRYEYKSNEFCFVLDLSSFPTLKLNKQMNTIISHISNYFEQFNSSVTSSLRSTDKTSLSYYVFDFEQYSDQMATLRDLKNFMIQRWHNSFFYALAYLFLIYSNKFYLFSQKKTNYTVCFFLFFKLVKSSWKISRDLNYVYG